MEDNYLNNNYTHILPWTAIVIYLFICFKLPKMIPKEGYNVMSIQKWWNLGLTIISIFLVLGMGIPYFTYCSKWGFWYCHCDPLRKLARPGIHIFCANIFTLTKYIELGDTLLLVLKKPDRKLGFLHWYHHITVLLFTWYAQYWEWPLGFYFSIINATIHSFMYFYYFLTCIGIRPHWDIFLTIAQIAQMCIGLIAVSVWAVRYLVWDEKCACKNPPLLMISCVIMYGSYLYLFAQFFINRYIRQSHKTKKAD